VQEVVAVLCDEYAVEPEQCRGDVIPFLERMAAIGAVVAAE
jgi:hypothetical protein